MTKDELQARMTAALAAVGFSDAHAAALAALLPNPNEREQVVLHIATQLPPPESDAYAAAAAWLALTAGRALRQRHPGANPVQVDYAAHAVTLMAVVLDPASLPPSGEERPPPPEWMN